MLYSVSAMSACYRRNYCFCLFSRANGRYNTLRLDGIGHPTTPFPPPTTNEYWAGISSLLSKTNGNGFGLYNGNE